MLAGIIPFLERDGWLYMETGSVLSKVVINDRWGSKLVV
jgi:hypothetical protein